MEAQPPQHEDPPPYASDLGPSSNLPITEITDLDSKALELSSNQVKVSASHTKLSEAESVGSVSATNLQHEMVPVTQQVVMSASIEEQGSEPGHFQEESNAQAEAANLTEESESFKATETQFMKSNETLLTSLHEESTRQTPSESLCAIVPNEIPEQNSESSGSSAGEDALENSTTPMTSPPPSVCGSAEPINDAFASSSSIADQIPELFAENITAKVLRTAQVALSALPAAFPEIVPQEDGSDGTYSLREADFWTCGFFPGTMYGILERLIKYPQRAQLPNSINLREMRDQFATSCRAWSEPIRGMDGRTDTHDIGFIIMPALRADWELFGNPRSLDSIIKAARSLATRYVSSARAIRSWDLLKKKDIEILDQEDNMIVIIDSMCNLDLLYYAAEHTQDSSLSDIATAHAITLLQSHLRPEPVLSSSKDVYRGQWYSTCHVANIDPKNGSLKRRLTAQGYEHDSTWSRGQAWGIFGYAETYMWTKDRQFLKASCGLAEYFLHRLETAPACVKKGRYVPLWDFDAPIADEENPLRDSSAGVIAANGMLILSQALASIDQISLSTRFRKAALRIVQDTLSFALAPEKAQLELSPYRHIRATEVIPGYRFDGLLRFGTANNNVNARKRYANHGLVYGDYYLVEFGNQLLRMGLH